MHDFANQRLSFFRGDPMQTKKRASMQDFLVGLMLGTATAAILIAACCLFLFIL